MTLDNKQLTMQDTLHTCLLCGKPAHECEKGVYRCDDEDCAFVWKVVYCSD